MSVLAILCLGTSVFAYSIDSLREQEKAGTKITPAVLTPKTQSTKTSQSTQTLNNSQSDGEMREIKNITEYFKYLPREVQRNWTPYPAESGYEVTVKFVVKRDGSIEDLRIVNTTLRDANASVLKAVKKGVPYQPLPKSYEKNSVTAQIILEYKK